MFPPEAQARQNIDAQLAACGWVVQNRDNTNLYAARGVAIREFRLTTGIADYLLVVDQKAVGVIEAKQEGVPLTAVAEQAERYTTGLPENIPHVCLPLPFMYTSTGVETLFRDNRDPLPRSRRVFTFHRPEALAEWLTQPQTLRARLHAMPQAHPLVSDALWSAQREAISNLEASLAQAKPRALIQMATGSGKTFTAVNFAYRLIKFGGAKRILFLVDRNNLGRQTHKEFDQFVTPDDGRKFSELYNIQHLQSNLLDDVSKVHITTIQRLYAMLAGEESFDPEREETSLWEAESALAGQPEKEVHYNPRIPIDYYDVIITDECHRSIYNLWRQVLEYFDAFLIGLTATPGKQTFGFFDQNLVMEYSRQRAVADGVNVDGEVYRIRTRITEQGGVIDKGWWVGRRDMRTRRQRWEQLDEDFSYNPEDLDRRVTSPGQIRTVLQAYQDSLAELFPARLEVPKTLIFAKDDNHAEEIVRIARELWGRGDDFCKKITYRTDGQPENLISAFRNAYNPRIAVTVYMIATGTDIKALEVLLFMRAVRSRVLFEQMLGRGTRVISDTDFQAVTTTPDAHKTRFVIVDAIGVTEQAMVETGTLERKRSATLKSLLEAVTMGSADGDVLASLARRLAMLDKRLSPAQRAEAQTLLDVPEAPQRFESLQALAHAMLDATDADCIVQQAVANGAADAENPTEAELAQAKQQLQARAMLPLAASPALRAFLQARELVIDETSVDAVLARGFDDDATARARSLVQSFQAFIADHKDDITALQVFYNRPHRQRALDYTQVRDLAARLQTHLHQSDPLFLTQALWDAYAKLEKDRVQGAGQTRVLADVVSLVRHAVLDEDLLPHPQRVAQRYQAWLAQQQQQGRQFDARQQWWLDEIARHIGLNVAIRLDDLNSYQFMPRGGQLAAHQAFGEALAPLLDELNAELGQA